MSHPLTLRSIRSIAALFLLLFVVLVSERWRGRHALSAWKTEMASRGEVLDALKIGPHGSNSSAGFARRLDEATMSLPAQLKEYSGQLSGMVGHEGNKARRGSQEPELVLSFGVRRRSSWSELSAAVRQGQPGLAVIRELMRHAPAEPIADVTQFLTSGKLPRLVSVRVSAQTLQVAALERLHAGDLPGAVDDLVALLSFGKLYQDDPTLVSCMIRVAVIGLSTDVCWDALQAANWTEDQLSKLQLACHDANRLLSDLQRALEFERAGHLLQWERFRCHSYNGWLAQYEDVYRSFGSLLPAGDAAPPVRLWRQWFFHPLWRLAWADQEELEYLRQSQKELALYRVRNHSWHQLERDLNSFHAQYQPPPGAWRFYLGLPLVDHLSDLTGGGAPDRHAYPYPDLSRAWFMTMKNLTLHQMVITAVALRRYEMRHGEVPLRLETLVPAYLETLPRDLMSGQLLHYRRNAEGFLLYSEGEDGRDQGGDCAAEAKETDGSPTQWKGLDWVWPQNDSG